MQLFGNPVSVNVVEFIASLGFLACLYDTNPGWAFTTLLDASVAESYNWCTVHHSAYDILLFAGIAVVAACLFQGKLASLLVLVTGEEYGTMGGWSQSP